MTTGTAFYNFVQTFVRKFLLSDVTVCLHSPAHEENTEDNFKLHVNSCFFVPECVIQTVFFH